MGGRERRCSRVLIIVRRYLSLRPARRPLSPFVLDHIVNITPHPCSRQYQSRRLVSATFLRDPLVREATAALWHGSFGPPKEVRQPRLVFLEPRPRLRQSSRLFSLLQTGIFIILTCRAAVSSLVASPSRASQRLDAPRCQARHPTFGFRHRRRPPAARNGCCCNTKPQHTNIRLHPCGLLYKLDSKRLSTDDDISK